MGITHAAVVVIPDDPAFPVGSDEWNADHILVSPLSGATVDGGLGGSVEFGDAPGGGGGGNASIEAGGGVPGQAGGDAYLASGASDGGGNAAEMLLGGATATSGGNVLFKGGNQGGGEGNGGDVEIRSGDGLTALSDSVLGARIIARGGLSDGTLGNVEVRTGGVAFSWLQMPNLPHGSTTDQVIDALIAAGLMAP